MVRFDDFLSIPVTDKSIADRTAVTVTFSQYSAEAGPGVSIGNNRKNCQLTFGIKYVLPLLRLLVIPILSLLQAPWRLLIWRCDYWLCEYFLGLWLDRHSSSDSCSEATISWMPELLLLSRQSTTVWPVPLLFYGFAHVISSPGTNSTSHRSLYRYWPCCRWA